MPQFHLRHFHGKISCDHYELDTENLVCDLDTSKEEYLINVWAKLITFCCSI